MTPDRESRKKIITAQRQNQILKAALEVFVARGYSAATIPAIAKSAGIAAGTIYLYYPSKRDLFIAVIETLMITPLSAIFKQNNMNQFDVIAKEAIQDRLGFIEGQLLPGFASLMGEIQRDPDLKLLFNTRLFQPFMSGMELFYKKRIDSGEFRRFEPAIAVRFVASLMIGMSVLRSLEGAACPINKISRENLTNELVNFILFGLTKRHGNDPVTREEINE